MKKRFRFVIETESELSLSNVCQALERDLAHRGAEWGDIKLDWNILRLDLKPAKEKPAEEPAP